MASRFYGSIIGLRPEYADRYRVLHRHTFPGVLERIARSNIRNYSIYLHENILFSYLEYVGEDYDADMAAIAADETTREWWQLTDPMQMALDERGEGEWWARLPVFHADDRAGSGASVQGPGVQRLALMARPANELARVLEAGPSGPGDRPGGIEVLRVFRAKQALYFYAEVHARLAAGTSGRSSDFTDCVARTLAARFRVDGAIVPMTEVFHTDGVLAVPGGLSRLRPEPRREPTSSGQTAPGTGPRPKKVFVSGCFDMLHSGHVAFLQEAARHGDVHVGIGSDETIHRLKGRYTVNTQDERKYMIEALDCVTACRINRGSGFLDFEEELHDLRPDILIVNADGHSPAKEALCRSLGIDYLVLQRIPHPGMPARDTTTLRTESRIPFRIDLAGGWLDQPFVSCHQPGPVLTISIEPTIEFNDRSGMASSTRRKAIELWHTAIPQGDPVRLAKVLFSYENPPGTKEVAGSQDALGIVLAGLNRLYYEGGYWPRTIESVHEEETLAWLENRLHLVTLGPRINSFRVLEEVRVDREGARSLSAAAEDCWRAVLARDARAFGDAFRRSFEAQVAMFPLMVDDGIREIIDQYRNRSLGWKLSGAGGGGYLILVCEDPVPNTVRVKIRRSGAD